MRKMNMLVSRLMMIAILMGGLFFTSCDKEEGVNESKVLIEYLESGIDPVNMGVIKTADKIQPDLVTGDVYVIDIRAKAAYDAGQLPVAVNKATIQLLDHFATTDLSSYEYVALVCITGQEAAWAATLLRMAGYPDVYSMKWGMCTSVAHNA